MFSAMNRKVKRWALRQYKKRPLVLLSDTTLRDGAQMPGVRLGLKDRVAIAQALAEAGIHSIDLGFPAAGESELRAVHEVAGCVRGPILSALARTVIADVDRAAEALCKVSPLKKAVTLFIGTSPIHRRHKLSMSQAQVIDAIVKTIEHAQTEFELISFGAEDASRTEPEFLHRAYAEAIAAGATSIGFTDTVGILTPAKAADTVKRIQDEVRNIDDALLAVHFHNDLGLATANTLACIEAGANIVQGTVNGIGERAGNMALEEIIVAMTLHADLYQREITARPEALHRLSRLVAERTGVEPAANKPIVGRNIFRTEAGIHQDGLLKDSGTYLPFRPELIGAGPVELLLGPNSGRSAVRYHLQKNGFEPTEEHVRLVLGYLKGDRFSPEEAAEAQAFLERVRPFLSTDEYGAEKSDRNETVAQGVERSAEP